MKFLIDSADEETKTKYNKLVSILGDIQLKREALSREETFARQGIQEINNLLAEKFQAESNNETPVEEQV